MNVQSIINKIKALQKLSQSSDINEAANAAKMADILISKYRIDEASLNVESSTQTLPIEDMQVLYETARVIRWKQYLANLLAHHYGCIIWNDCVFGASAKGHKVSRYRLVGQESDLELTRFMFGWLTHEIERLVKLNCKGQGHIASHSYCEGAVIGIKQQLIAAKEQMKKEAAEANKCVALSILDNRLVEAKNRLAELHPHLTTIKTYSQSRFDQSAYSKGVAAGKNISLAKGLSGSKNTTKLFNG